MDSSFLRLEDSCSAMFNFNEALDSGVHAKPFMDRPFLESRPEKRLRLDDSFAEEVRDCSSMFLLLGLSNGSMPCTCLYSVVLSSKVVFLPIIQHQEGAIKQV